MGRMKELAEQVAELKRCGEILIDISENLTQMFSAADVKKPVKEEPAAPKEEKLSDIDPSKYEELLQKMEVI